MAKSSNNNNDKNNSGKKSSYTSKKTSAKKSPVKNKSYSSSTTSTTKSTLEKFKMEAANEVGIDLKGKDTGDLTARQAGSIGGQMVKKMIESYKKNLK